MSQIWQTGWTKYELLCLHEETHVHVRFLQAEPVEGGPEDEETAVKFSPQRAVDLLPQADLLRHGVEGLAAGVVPGYHRAREQAKLAT